MWLEFYDDLIMTIISNDKFQDDDLGFLDLLYNLPL